MVLSPRPVNNTSDKRLYGTVKSDPTMFGSREQCEAGGLASYGANQRATYMRLAAYANRLLRGEKPGELPIAQPATFELVLNVRTARAIGSRSRLPSTSVPMR